MILMGDEVRRTQHGNNNAYCHDDEANWFDWTLQRKHADVHRFVTLLNAQRHCAAMEHAEQRVTLRQFIDQATKSWHGTQYNQPDWGDTSHCIAFTAELRGEKLLIYLILNAYWEPRDFELPPEHDGKPIEWKRWIDTALDSPNDITDWQSATRVSGRAYRVESRSVVALIADSEKNP